MANRKVLFGLIVLCLSVYLTECGRFGGGSRSSGRSSSRGGSSWGKGWGSSSSSGSSWSKPSSSWGSSGNSYKPSSSWNTGSSSSGSSWGSSGNSYKPSSSWNTGSSSGSSTWNKPSYPSSVGLSGTGSGSHGYPSSSSGLSGTGSGSHGYPSSSSGLFGTGSGSHGYPSSSSGLSGTGSGSHGYPSSSSGLSGTGSGSHKYPSGTGLSGSSYPSSGSHNYPSGSGLSGSGSSKYPSASSGSHYYPSGTGLSGSRTVTPYHHSVGSSYPKNTYNSYAGYGGSHSHQYVPQSYYTAPQHVYITQYRDSGSRYSNLLTGLTLYNMGRSHSHYHDHYYSDDYYRHRYNGNSYNRQSQSSYNKPSDEATCTLRIKENGKLEILKIPCEIVSTFTEGGKRVKYDTPVNRTVCTTNTTSIKIASPQATTASPISVNMSAITTEKVNINVTANNSEGNVTADISNLNTTDVNIFDTNVNSTQDKLNTIAEETSSNIMSLTPARNATVATVEPIKNNSIFTTIKTNKTEGNIYTETVKTVNDTETIIANVTTCITTQNYTDPLSVKGGPIVDPTNMECSVDIKTKTSHIRNTVECKTLMEYSKMPPPINEVKPLLPAREKLKSWLQSPPWWMSMLIAV